MKRGIGALVGIAVAVAVVVAAYMGYRAVFVDEEVVYVQVDDGRAVSIGDAGETKYEYELPARTQDGTERRVTFQTSKRLRDDAYLRMRTLALRGVVSWEEVAWDDVPAAAQEGLPAPAGA